MPRPVDFADVLITIVKAILITAAILYLGRFFGLNVREAGGNLVANARLSAAQSA
jgi:hypothetical protein